MIMIMKRILNQTSSETVLSPNGATYHSPWVLNEKPICSVGAVYQTSLKFVPSSSKDYPLISRVSEMLIQIGGKLVICLSMMAMLVGLSGCGHTTEVQKPFSAQTGKQGKFVITDVSDQTGYRYQEDLPPAEFLQEVEDYVRAGLQGRGLLAPSSSPGAYRVSIEVYYYRMRGSFNQIMYGAMAGKDGVESRVRVMRPGDGSTLAESKAYSYNVTAFGGSGYLAKAHADEIVGFFAN